MGGELPAEGGPRVPGAGGPGPAGGDETGGLRVPGPPGLGDADGPVAGLARERRRRVLLSVLAALVLLGGGGGLAAWLSHASAVSHRPLRSAAGVVLVSPAQPVAGRLNGVSVVSATSAWAVGMSCEPCGASWPSRALILHWDGTTWSRVRSPSPGGTASLQSVSSGPGGSAWAVGYYCPSACTGSLTGVRTLTLHWDGTAWSQVASPSPSPRSGFAYLTAVTLVPGSGAWAVGAYCASGCGTASAVERPLILRWDGATWSQAASPRTGGGGNLNSVSPGPGGGAWAVGGYCPSRCGKVAPAGSRTLILHWDGTAWSRMTSPRPGGAEVLASVDSGAAGTAWAAGFYCASGCGTSSEYDQALILHWDGTAWSQVTSRTPGLVNTLLAVSAGPVGSTWASGLYCPCRTSSEFQALIMRWDGTTWSQVTSPSPGRSSQLLAVSSNPAGGTWAVGWYCTSGCGTQLETDQALLLRWHSTARPAG